MWGPSWFYNELVPPTGPPPESMDPRATIAVWQLTICRFRSHILFCFLHWTPLRLHSPLLHDFSWLSCSPWHPAQWPCRSGKAHGSLSGFSCNRRCMSSFQHYEYVLTSWSIDRWPSKQPLFFYMKLAYIIPCPLCKAYTWRLIAFHMISDITLRNGILRLMEILPLSSYYISRGVFISSTLFFTRCLTCM